MQRGQASTAVAEQQVLTAIVAAPETSHDLPSRITASTHTRRASGAGINKRFAVHFMGRILLTANIIFQFWIFLTILMQGQFIIAVETNKTILISEILASAFLVIYGVYWSAQCLLERTRNFNKP